MRMAQEDTIVPTLAQQIFTIGSAFASGIAGLIIARHFAGLDRVPTNTVAGATIVSIIATLGAGLYLAKKAREAL